MSNLEAGKIPQPEYRKSSPHSGCPYPTTRYFLGGEWSHALITFEEKSSIYIPTHFVQFFFTQKLLVLYSSHVYASAILLASFLTRWYSVSSLQFGRA